MGYIRHDHEIVALELAQRRREGRRGAHVDVELLRVECAGQVARALRLTLDVEDRGATPARRRSR